MSRLSESFRSWRRRFKGALPYVRRRQYRILKRKYEELSGALASGVQPATSARLNTLKPCALEPGQEICLFVSFMAQPRLKPHVVLHIQHLLRQGIRVVLIANTEIDAGRIEIDAELASGLSGIFVRENLGYDFAAWAHLFALEPAVREARRLYLINDSIVGPLDAGHFDALIARVRSADADVLGLTECLSPLRHLQSFFLVFNDGALRHEAVQRLWRGILIFASKSQVIDVYETNITAELGAKGLRCLPLFPSLSNDPISSNDVHLRWAELIRLGFPYVKTSVVRAHPHNTELCALVPALYRETA